MEKLIKTVVNPLSLANGPAQTYPSVRSAR
jgi:hypothetical protein